LSAPNSSREKARGHTPEDICPVRELFDVMWDRFFFFATRVSGRKEIDWALQRNFTCLLTRDGP